MRALALALLLPTIVACSSGPPEVPRLAEVTFAGPGTLAGVVSEERGCLYLLGDDGARYLLVFPPERPYVEGNTPINLPIPENGTRMEGLYGGPSHLPRDDSSWHTPPARHCDASALAVVIYPG